MKSKRQEKILELIAQYAIETQEELLERLSECGIPSTQATVSRDIKQLHLYKEPCGGGRYRYASSARSTGCDFNDRLQRILRECSLSVDYAQNLVVLKTMPGLASAAGAAFDAMDDLRQGIRLRAYAQTDPVVEYKREGFDMFEAMTNAIKEEIVRRVFLVRLKTNEELRRERVAKVTSEGAGDKTVKRQPVVKKIKIGPNDPCPCGSGKKYKKCCRDKDLAAGNQS